MFYRYQQYKKHNQKFYRRYEINQLFIFFFVNDVFVRRFY